MRAIDVMVRDVVTVHPDTDVAEAIKLLAEHDVSALPVVDAAGQSGWHSQRGRPDPSRRDRHRKASAMVAGGGDRREQAGRGIRQVAWQGGRRDNDNGCRFGVRGDAARRDCRAVRAKADQARSGRQGRQARRRRQSIEPDPGARDGGRPYGPARRNGPPNPARADVSAARSNRGPISASRNITVSDRVVHLWGLVGSEAERKALLALAESVPGVSRVSDEMIPAY